MKIRPCISNTRKTTDYGLLNACDFEIFSHKQTKRLFPDEFLRPDEAYPQSSEKDIYTCEQGPLDINLLELINSCLIISLCN